MIHTYFEGNATRCFNKKKKTKKTKTNGIILNRDTFEIYVPFQR